MLVSSLPTSGAKVLGLAPAFWNSSRHNGFQVQAASRGSQKSLALTLFLEIWRIVLLARGLFRQKSRLKHARQAGGSPCADEDVQELEWKADGHAAVFASGRSSRVPGRQLVLILRIVHSDESAEATG